MSSCSSWGAVKAAKAVRAKVALPSGSCSSTPGACREGTEAGAVDGGWVRVGSWWVMVGDITATSRSGQGSLGKGRHGPWFIPVCIFIVALKTSNLLSERSVAASPKPAHQLFSGALLKSSI